MVEFGEQLRRAREEKGITQQTLAEQLFVTRSAVSKWERGERYPDLPTTGKISEILEVSLDDLLSGKDMAKAVERNPVIENKFANNIMITLYAVVLFANILLMLKTYTAAKLLLVDGTDDSVGSFQIILFGLELINSGLIIAIIFYGLFHAIRGTLSQRRMGAVIAAFWGIAIMYELAVTFSFYSTADPNSVVTIENPGEMILRYILMITGVIAANMYFIKKKNQVIWPILCIVVPVMRIVRTVIDTVIYIGNYGDLLEALELDEYGTGMAAIIGIIIGALDVISTVFLYGLMIYQVVTLYKKRKAVTVSAITE